MTLTSSSGILYGMNHTVPALEPAILMSPSLYFSFEDWLVNTAFSGDNFTIQTADISVSLVSHWCMGECAAPAFGVRQATKSGVL